MKGLSLAILLLFTSVNFANVFIGHPSGGNQLDTLMNQVDELGRKQGNWVYLGKDQPEKGYPEEAKIAEGPFIDNRKEGHWTMYFQDGATPKVEGEYVNNRPNGTFKKYYPNGKLKEEGTFSKRFYTDSLRRYNEAEILIYEAVLDEEGKETGNVTYFYENGQPEFTYTAIDGIPQGEATRFWPNGDIKEQITFDEEGVVLETSGEIAMVNKEVIVKKVKTEKVKLPPKPNVDHKFKPNGYNKIFNSDKELWMEGDFNGGMLFNGRLYVYDEDGLLYKVEVYKEGKYHSEGQL